MATDSNTDFDRLCTELETQEIEAPDGIVPPQLYGQLLAVYLYQNDLPNAKFLWKRIPAVLKTANPDLALIWAVGEKMWQRDITGMFTALNQDWSDGINAIMTAIRESIRSRMLALIQEAYSSISADDLAKSTGLSVTDAVQAVLAQGWKADARSGFVTPCKKPPVEMPAISREQQLVRLTDFVSFLEN